MRIRPIVALLAAVGLTAGLAGFPEAGAQPAPVAQTLCAKKGATTIGSVSVPIWGYAAGPSATAGAPTLPGPEIRVTEGQGLELTLEVDGLGPDAMTEPVSIVVPNVGGQPDTVGVGPGGTKTYSLGASDLAPGAYLYESGINSSIQVPMGLHGALIVDSADGGTAYGAGSGTDFDVEAVLTLSEIDTDLNTLDDPNDFVPNDYAPEYLLIGGQPTPQILAAPGDEVLLRFLNAGTQPHVMAVLGVHQTVVGRSRDPWPRTTAARLSPSCSRPGSSPTPSWPFPTPLRAPCSPCTTGTGARPPARRAEGVGSSFPGRRCSCR